MNESENKLVEVSGLHFNELKNENQSSPLESNKKEKVFTK